MIRIRICAYQGIRNVSSVENFAYVFNGWCLFMNEHILFIHLLPLSMSWCWIKNSFKNSGKLNKKESPFTFIFCLEFETHVIVRIWTAPLKIEPFPVTNLLIVALSETQCSWVHIVQHKRNYFLFIQNLLWSFKKTKKPSD